MKIEIKSTICNNLSEIYSQTIPKVIKRLLGITVLGEGLGVYVEAGYSPFVPPQYVMRTPSNRARAIT